MMPADLPKSARIVRRLKQMASPRWMALFFVLTAAAALAVAIGGMPATTMMLAPFGLLVLNLCASIITNPRFRADLPLLVFHLALLALVVLFTLARLTYMDGSATLTRGTMFEGQMGRLTQGPLHGETLRSLHFANEGFTENFAARGKYYATYNLIRWWDDAGKDYLAEIGDDRPLVLQGHRIYTTAHRGFSPLFNWQPKSGAAELGTVQLPPDTVTEPKIGTATSWQLPGGPNIWVMLVMQPAAVPAPGAQRGDLGAREIPHHLVLRVGERRLELRQGETIDLEGGQLTYLRLDSWMNYRIVHDPMIPWIAATLFVGIASLIWFYIRRLWGRPVNVAA